MVDLNSDKTEEMAKLSPLMDATIVTHLLGLVMNSKEETEAGA
jgi:hypothetical protein